LRLEESLRDPQLRARGMVVETNGLCHAGAAVRLGGMPPIPDAPAPACAGADTDAILEALGVDAEELARLRGAGVV
ncbi:CoA transferase, partial [Thauera sp. UPWRP]